MTDQEIILKIRAETKGLSQALRRTNTDLKKLQSQFKKVNEAGKAIDQTNRSFAQLAKHIGQIVSIYAVADGFREMVAVSAQFQQAVNEIGVISGASAGELTLLADKARELGATTQYSATEVADGMKQMAMSGLSVQQSYDGIEAVLNLAAVGMTSVGEAAEIAMTAMHAWGLNAKDMGDISDVLAKTAGNSATTIELLGRALAKVGPVAKNSGVSLEETAAALGVLADAGRKGAEAGTQLKIVMSRLTGNQEAKKYIDELGIAIYDSSGKALKFNQMLLNVKEALAKLPPQMRKIYESRIFGEEALAAGEILMEGLDKIKVKLNELKQAMSDDYAEKAAAKMLDSLSGDWKAFKSALESVALEIGEGLLPALREAVQGFTEFLRGMDPDALSMFGEALGSIAKELASLIEFVARVVVGFGTLGGQSSTLRVIIEMLGNTIILMTGGVLAARKGFEKFEGAIKLAAGAASSFYKALGPWGIALTLLVTGIAAVVSEMDRLEERANKAVETAANQSDMVGKLTDSYGDLIEQAKKYGGVEAENKQTFLDSADTMRQQLESQIKQLEERTSKTEAEKLVLEQLKAQLYLVNLQYDRIAKLKVWDKQATPLEKVKNGIKLTAAEMKKLNTEIGRMNKIYETGVNKAVSNINKLILKEQSLNIEIAKLAQEKIAIAQRAADSEYDIYATVQDEIAALYREGLSKEEAAYQSFYQKIGQLASADAEYRKVLAQGRFDRAKELLDREHALISGMTKAEFEEYKKREGITKSFVEWKRDKLLEYQKKAIDLIEKEKVADIKAVNEKLRMKKLELEATKHQIEANYLLIKSLNAIFSATKGKNLLDPKALKKAEADMKKTVAKIDAETKKIQFKIDQNKLKIEGEKVGLTLKESASPVDVTMLPKADLNAAIAEMNKTKTAVEKEFDFDIPIAANKTAFEAEMAKLIDLYKKKRLGLKVDAEIAQAEADIKKMYAEFDDDPLKIRTEMQAEHFIEHAKQVADKVKLKVKLKPDEPSWEKDVEALGKAAMKLFENVELPIGADPAKFKSLVSELYATYQEKSLGIPVDGKLDRINAELMELYKEYVSKELGLPVGADLTRFMEGINKASAKAASTTTYVNLDAKVNKYMSKLLGVEQKAENTTATANLDADPEEANTALDDFVKDVDEATPTVDVTADVSVGSNAVDNLKRKIDSTSGTVSIKGNQSPAMSELHSAVSAIDNASGTVDINADASEVYAVKRDLERTTHSKHIIHVVEEYDRAAGGSIPKRLAGGGVFSGYGKVPGYDPTDSDKVNARLTGGEFVIKRDSVDYYGPGLFYAYNSKLLPKFANGGEVDKVVLKLYDKYKQSELLWKFFDPRTQRRPIPQTPYNDRSHWDVSDFQFIAKDYSFIEPIRDRFMGWFADGGRVPGYDATDSDGVNAYLTAGEFVMRREAVDAYGSAFMQAVNEQKLPRFADGGLVGGGGASIATMRPINIVLGDKKYPAQAAPDVAEQLVRELRQWR